MSPPEQESTRADSRETSPYRAFLDVRDQILRYKWIASEKAGHDIGFEAALLAWTAGTRTREDG